MFSSLHSHMQTQVKLITLESIKDPIVFTKQCSCPTHWITGFHDTGF